MCNCHTELEKDSTQHYSNFILHFQALFILHIKQMTLWEGEASSDVSKTSVISESDLKKS